MEGRARTRGPRSGRGRGVRTRGGRGGGALPEAHPGMVLEGHHLPQPSRRGRRGYGWREGRATSIGPASRSRGNIIRSHAMDELRVYNIEDLPVGVPLERPLHVKRRRTWSPPISLQHLPTAAPAVVVPVVLVERVVIPEPNVVEEAMGPVPISVESPTLPPSPAMFVEYGSGSSTPVQRSLSCRPISSAEILHRLSYGSEPDSDGSADEEEVAPEFVPRSLRILMEMPEDEPAASSEPAVVPAAEGLMPNNFYHFEWTAFPDPPIPAESRREKFSETNVGPTTPCVDPYDTFIAIWDRQFMEHIASETNKYAQLLTVQMMNNHNLRPASRICDWKDTTVDELYTYFALILAMGVVIKSAIQEYWNVNNDIFYTPGFSAQMSLRRFQLLSRCLHFNDNENMCALELDASEAKLYKIEPVLSHLNKKFETLYKMRQNIALDESLLQWKGWLDINQFIPNKAAAVGIKTYEICESQTGYLWRLEVHAHRKGSLPQQQSDPLDASTPAIVLRLIQGLENKGHTLWMDNYYNSPALARRLKTLGFDCVGTLRTNRQFVSEALTSLTKANMRPGQIAGFTSGDVDLIVWRDQNLVATISTYHGNAITVVDGTTKPIVILDYNVMMGGVDKKDQMLAMYPIERKRTKVWYKKLFRRLLNVSVLNSFILVKQSSSSITHRAFRISLIKSLIAKHSFRPFPSVTAATSQNILFHAKIHRLSAYPFMPGNRQRQRHVCCQCKKRIHLYCVGCAKPVCMEPCFAVLHDE